MLGLWRDLCEPDRSFYSFYLTEKRANAAELVMAPMLDKPCCLRRNLPLIRIWQRTPDINVSTYFIDDRSNIVLLRLRGKPLAFIKNDCFLFGTLFLLLRLRDRRDKLGVATGVYSLLRGLPVLIKLPVPFGILIRGV